MEIAVAADESMCECMCASMVVCLHGGWGKGYGVTCPKLLQNTFNMQCQSTAGVKIASLVNYWHCTFGGNFTDLNGEHVMGSLQHMASNVDEWPVSLLEWWMNESGAKESIIEHWKLYI